MAVIEKNYMVEVSQVGAKNCLSNHGILDLLESIACYHSELVKFGINQINDVRIFVGSFTLES